MSFLKLLEGAGEFYLPAAITGISESGVIFVSAVIKLPTQEGVSINYNDSLCIGKIGNLKRGEKIKIKIKKIPFIANKKYSGQGYEVPNVKFLEKIDDGVEYNKINECFIELSRLLSESSLNAISHLNEEDCLKNIEHIIKLFNDLEEWHKIPPNALYSLIGSLKDGKSFNVLLKALKTTQLMIVCFQ